MKKILILLFRWENVPAYLTMAFIFFMSNIPGDQLKNEIFRYDKVLHAVAYAWLTFTFLMAFRERHWQRFGGKIYPLVFFLVILFGFSDEYHQSFVPFRKVSYGDILADATGTLLICSLFYGVRRFLLNRA